MKRIFKQDLFLGLFHCPRMDWGCKLDMAKFSKKSRPQGGPKLAKKSLKNELSWRKMKKNEKNSYLRSFFGLEARPEGKFRGQVPYTEVLGPLGYRGGQKWPKKLKNCYKMDKNEQMWKELLNKLHFWAGPTVQGWIEGVSLIWQHSKNSRPQGGPNLAKKNL